VLTTSGGAAEVELADSILECVVPTDMTLPLVDEVLVDDPSLPEAEEVLPDEPPTTLTPLSEDVLPELVLLDELALPDAVVALDDDPPTTVTEEELSDWARASGPPRNPIPRVSRTAMLDRDRARVRAVTPALMITPN
jgi:hypothetical protein